MWKPRAYAPVFGTPPPPAPPLTPENYSIPTPARSWTSCLPGNIEAFGGDPSRVGLVGWSAGQGSRRYGDKDPKPGCRRLCFARDACSLRGWAIYHETFMCREERWDTCQGACPNLQLSRSCHRSSANPVPRVNPTPLQTTCLLSVLAGSASVSVHLAMPSSRGGCWNKATRSNSETNGKG